jgi:hypothetical protein
MLSSFQMHKIVSSILRGVERIYPKICKGLVDIMRCSLQFSEQLQELKGMIAAKQVLNKWRMDTRPQLYGGEASEYASGISMSNREKHIFNSTSNFCPDSKGPLSASVSLV